VPMLLVVEIFQVWFDLNQGGVSPSIARSWTFTASLREGQALLPEEEKGKKGGNSLKPSSCMCIRAPDCQNHDIMAVVADAGWHVTRLGEAGIAPYLIALRRRAS
jgi:hypothetical protein